jgi:polyhydroxybutyrate depolymerase
MWTPRTRAVVLVVLSLAVLGTLVGCGRHAGRSDDGGDGPSTTVVHLTVDGVERSYRLHVPSTRARARPLVLVLHGGFGSGRQAEQAYGWDEVADREDFLVAYPDGWRRAWNTGGGCCGRPAARGLDDVRFLEEVVRRVRSAHDVDADRIYLTGMSNGAMMAYTMACRSSVFAAIAPVAGTQLVSCPGAAPVSLIHVHGLTDSRVRFSGGPGEGVAEVDGPPVEQVVATWRTIDRCEASAVTASGAVRTSTAACAEGRAVTLVTIAGAGHQWPGSAAGRAGRLLGADPPSQALDATAAIWAFFAAHPKSR